MKFLGSVLGGVARPFGGRPGRFPGLELDRRFGGVTWWLIGLPKNALHVREAGPSSARCLPAIAGVTVAAAGCAAWAIISFGSLRLGWLYAGGVRVWIEPSTVTIADAKVGDSRDAVFLLRNLADDPVTIVGAATSCTCLSPGDDLPFVVPPRHDRELRVRVDLSRSPGGPLDQVLVYRTDYRAALRLRARVVGRVEGGPVSNVRPDDTPHSEGEKSGG